MTDDVYADFLDGRRYVPAILKEDLYAFLEFCFPIIDGRKELIRAEYIEYLTHELTQVVLGRKRRLIINLPPRHLKSVIASVVLPMFLLMRDPKLRIAVISHNTSLARDLAIKCHRLATSRGFQE